MHKIMMVLGLLAIMSMMLLSSSQPVLVSMIRFFDLQEGSDLPFTGAFSGDDGYRIVNDDPQDGGDIPFIS